MSQERKVGVYICGGCGIADAVDIDQMETVATGVDLEAFEKNSSQPTDLSSEFEDFLRPIVGQLKDIRISGVLVVRYAGSRSDIEVVPVGKVYPLHWVGQPSFLHD